MDSQRDARRRSSATSPMSRRATQVAESCTPRDADGLSESFQSTETVRRRPQGSYGTMPTPAPSEPRPSVQEPHQTSRHSQSSRPTIIDRTKSFPRSRRPLLSRHASTTTPHRGEFFSAHDDSREVEADAAGRAYSTRRRQPPSITLSRVQSYRTDNTNEADPRLSATRPSSIKGDAQDDIEETDENETQETSLDAHASCDSESDLSDAESFTLKDRQQAINETHPFGIRVWKPALYKKDRSIQKFAEGDIHSSPGGHVSNWLVLFNLLWTLCFGWWMACLPAFGAIICLVCAAAPSGREYGRVLWGLAGYLFYPFGKYVRLEKDEQYSHEDGDEGRSISEYEQWQNGDLEYGRLFFGPDRTRTIVGRSRSSIDSDNREETDSLLGRGQRSHQPDHPPMKRRLFGRGEWNMGRVIFFFFFYCLISPSLIIISLICWFLVFWIPMGKVTMLLFDHLRRHPLALSFESHLDYSRTSDGPDSSILLCTYRAVGIKYWKYTIDGTNVFLFNLMAVVFFVIFDWMVLGRMLHWEMFITGPAFLFLAGLVSIIPLAYFIGQAVASISAQSSMGLGAAVNAFFATVVEVFLYCVALNQGKGQLVEGSIVGSIFAGILFLPGISMCFGALKRKTQRFNAKSAGVTSTMLLFAVIGAFGPTLFYQIYGTHKLQCLGCEDFDDGGGGGGDGGDGGHGRKEGRDCRRCYFSQSPALDDRFYLEAVRPYCYMAAFMLFFSYLIGLWFTLRTHAAVIWNSEVDEKRHEDPIHTSSIPRPSQPLPAETSSTDIRDTHLYKRILGQSLKQVGLPSHPEERGRQASASNSEAASNGPSTLHVVPPKTTGGESQYLSRASATLGQETSALVREVAEIAATAATIASRDRHHSRKASFVPPPSSSSTKHTASRAGVFEDEVTTTHGAAGHDGHDAPNWSRGKSSLILLTATILYAIIAEILVDTVDVVLESFSIDQKFLGITLFALVPNTTEFLNAISFAMNGNIALSMEIGSAYALQVCLLQVPALVLYSALYPFQGTNGDNSDAAMHTFSLLFPQWDMVTVILCVFLLSYVYGEGKSNYFKGSILVLAYMVVVIGYYFSGFTADYGAERFDVLGSDGQYTSFKTIGRSTKGFAY